MSESKQKKSRRILKAIKGIVETDHYKAFRKAYPSDDEKEIFDSYVNAFLNKQFKNN
jgi:hypothetical protein